MSFVTVSMNPAQANSPVRREIERLLQDVVPVRTSPAWMPAANGFEDATGFTMEFDVPGYTAEELEVTAQDGALIVRGNRSEREVSGETRVLFMERPASAFERRLRLPKTADLANITATHTLGVLTVHVAKLAAVAPRKITINAGESVSTQQPAQ